MKVRYIESVLTVREDLVKTSKGVYHVRSLGTNVNFTENEVEKYGDRLAKKYSDVDGVYVVYLSSTGSELRRKTVRRRVLTPDGSEEKEYVFYYKRLMLYVPKHVVEKYGYKYRKTKISGTGIYVIKPLALETPPLDIIRFLAPELLGRINEPRTI